MILNLFRILRPLKSCQTQVMVGAIIFFSVFMFSAVTNSGRENEVTIHVDPRRVEPLDPPVLEQEPSGSSNDETEETVPLSKDSWEKVQESRKNAIREACKDIPKDVLFNTMLKTKASRKQLLVDDRHKAIYCFIPKVASVNWRKAWMVMSGMSDNVKGMNRKQMDEAFETKTLKDVENRRELEQKLTNYTKVMVVRNPLERLLSVYFDDVRTQRFNTLVLRNVRKTRPEAKTTDITWPEFVHFIMTEGVIDSRYFLTYEDLCHPCALDYDVIVKFETFKEDSENFMKLVGSKETIADPSLDNPRVDAETFRKYSEELSETQLEALRRKYNRDFKLFQYS